MSKKTHDALAAEARWYSSRTGNTQGAVAALSRIMVQ
jgi:hypothetical protein